MSLAGIYRDQATKQMILIKPLRDELPKSSAPVFGAIRRIRADHCFPGYAMNLVPVVETSNHAGVYIAGIGLGSSGTVSY